MPSEAAQENARYYQELSGGRDDYWRYMAAPRHRIAVLCELLDELAPTSILDLGCGNGQLLGELAKVLPAAQLAGLDLSRAQIESNRRALASVSWFVADLDRELDGSEDPLGTHAAVVACELIEHLDHPAVFLRNARSLVAEDGAILLSTQSGPIRETERRIGHRRHFSTGELAELLRACGFRRPRVWNTGFPFHDLSKWYANRDPDASMERFGDQAYGVSQRAICGVLRGLFRLNSQRRGAQLFAVAYR